MRTCLLASSHARCWLRDVMLDTRKTSRTSSSAGPTHGVHQDTHVAALASRRRSLGCSACSSTPSGRFAGYRVISMSRQHTFLLQTHHSHSRGRSSTPIATPRRPCFDSLTHLYPCRPIPTCAPCVVEQASGAGSPTGVPGSHSHPPITARETGLYFLTLFSQTCPVRHILKGCALETLRSLGPRVCKW